ncbi:MAG TPA: ABC transporter substrate-binding protein [Burkholderiales bacterium]|nr:ABC transporter substrate-binding protein [Burkholderiales bacterium]
MHCMLENDRLVVRSLFAVALFGMATAGFAQKSGGVLRLANDENPPSASIHEEGSNIVTTPFVPVFNNLVDFDPAKNVSRQESIVPELATSWAWSADHKTLTFKLRRGVKWHDGKPFTSADVKCTWDTLRGVRDAGWRRTPRAAWFSNVQEIVTEGDDQVSFRLARPQPSFLSFFAGGWSPVYPCHVDGRQMRKMPIGTGPFMVKSIESGKMIRLVRNPNYWKPGRPYLDGIDMPIIPSPSTRNLAFIAGETDFYTPSETLLAEVKARVPDAICQVGMSYAYTQLLMNPAVPPFGDVRVRKAAALAIDRNAFVKTKGAGLDRIGGELMPPPEGAWGLDPAELASLPGYGPDIEKNREEARTLMRQAGYGPDKPLTFVMSTRDVARYRDTAVMLLDQLSRIYMKGEMKTVDSALWNFVLGKRSYTVAVRSRGQAMDDPDVAFYEGYSCSSKNNYSGYCDKETDALIERQSATVDVAERKRLVKQIDRKLQMEAARPTITFAALPYCWRPYLKGYVPSLNNQYSHRRMENVWLDK